MRHQEHSYITMELREAAAATWAIAALADVDELHAEQAKEVFRSAASVLRSPPLADEVRRIYEEFERTVDLCADDLAPVVYAVQTRRALEVLRERYACVEMFHLLAAVDTPLAHLPFRELIASLGDEYERCRHEADDLGDGHGWWAAPLPASEQVDELLRAARADEKARLNTREPRNTLVTILKIQLLAKAAELRRAPVGPLVAGTFALAAADERATPIWQSEALTVSLSSEKLFVDIESPHCARPNARPVLEAGQQHELTPVEGVPGSFELSLNAPVFESQRAILRVFLQDGEVAIPLPWEE